MSFLHECLLQKSCTPSLPFLQKGRRGGSRDALLLLPEGFPLLLLNFGPAGGVEEPLVGRSVHGSSLLSPRFLRGLGIQELFSCGGLLLPVLSRLALPPQRYPLGEVLGRGSLQGLSLLPLPPHLCTLGKVVGRVSLPSTAPVRVLPGLPILGLGSREGVWARSWSIGSRVRSCCSRCGFSFHARSAVETLWVWILSFAVLPCVVAVRSLAVYGPLAVSWRSL